MAKTAPPAAGTEKQQPAPKVEAPALPALFVAKVSTLGAVSLRKGEIAVDGAEILKTHGHLFAPLTITYRA